VNIFWNRFAKGNINYAKKIKLLGLILGALVSHFYIMYLMMK